MTLSSSGARRRCSRPIPLSSLLSASPLPPPNTVVCRPISSRRHHPTSTAPLTPHPSTTSSITRRRPHLPPLRLRLHRSVQPPPTSPRFSSASRSSHPIHLSPNSGHHPIRRISTSTTAPAATTTISVGDKLPNATLAYFDLAGEGQTVAVSELTKPLHHKPSPPLPPPFRLHTAAPFCPTPQLPPLPPSPPRQPPPLSLSISLSISISV